MANQNTNNIVDSVVDAQKKAVDTMVENTKKFANGNNLVNETVQKGSEWYKNWLDNQNSFFKNTSSKAEAATESAKENASQMNEFYQNWMNSQAAWSKQMWDMSQNWFNNTMSNATAANNNPMAQWNNMMNQWTNWANNMNQSQNWMNNMNNWTNQFQSAFNMDSWKKNTENFTSLFNQYTETLNSNFAEMQKNMQNGTIQDAYRNMVNVAEGFSRFNQMWAPMWKSIQEKTFNMDMYKQWMNPVAYKEMMDKYFGFMPEGTREYMQQMTTMMQDSMKQFGQFGNQGYQQMRGMVNSMPFNGQNMFGDMMSNYTTWYNMLNDTMSPITKMMTPNQQTKGMLEVQDIANRMMIYNIKNAEMQYMVYTQGAKVMDQLAQNILSKIENGEDVNSMMALYQEWMNISDKTFVSLFESDEYSAIMAEVSAMQMRLKKDMEAQAEKFLVGVPVATRSEMDELYKTIYDLKKQVRELEKLAVNNISANNSEEAPKAKATKK
jgi:polyhydroxyalkanoate synthesis regulator phasin